MKNSYEVFITPTNYAEKCKSISQLLCNLNNSILNSAIFKKMADFYNSFSEVLKLNPKSGTVNASSKINYLFNYGNVKMNIPDYLTKYECYINSEESTKWATWHSGGANFIREAKCPFCCSDISNELENINKIDKIFGKNAEIYNKIYNVFSNYESIFDKSTFDNVVNIVSNNKIDSEQKKFITSIFSEVQAILEKIQVDKAIDYSSLKEINDLKKYFEGKKIEIAKINYFKSFDILNELQDYNKKIDSLLKIINSLTKEVNELNSSIRKNTAKNINDINNFLEIAGINYLVYEAENHILVKPKVIDIPIKPNEIMSYGELNAFALALFVCDVKNKENTLIVLDDPISSYDYNKKYAILHYLFIGKGHLLGKTVLLLTHELEPIIDIYSIYKHNIPDFINIMYIENNNGKLNEKKVDSNELESILKLTKKFINDNNLHVINRLIHLRRYLEFIDDYSCAYDLISSLFKGREVPTKRNQDPLNKDEISMANDVIRKNIKNFDYISICETIKNVNSMVKLYKQTKNNYEKLEIFRIIYKNNKYEGVPKEIMKFINETYHIENSYIYQLDPYQYNQVPNYIIEFCDRVIKNIL